jgi:hypothetical protein
VKRGLGFTSGALLLAIVSAATLLLSGPTPAKAALSAPTVLAPLDGAVVPADAPLAWSVVDGATGYRIELADDATFERVWYTADTVATSLEPTSYFTPGIQHWRVAALDGTDVGVWRASSFTVERLDVPAPLAPAEGATFVYPGPGPILSWTPSLYGPYEIRLVGPSGTSGFIEDATSAAVPFVLRPGTWTWSVRPTGNAGSMPWSSTRSFVVTWPDDHPVITAPAMGAAVEVELLDWDPIPGASAYDLQESSDKTFPSGSSFATTVSATRVDLGITDQTTTRWWRIRGRNGPLVGPWSTPRSLVHAAWSDAPADLWPAGGTLGGAPTIRWSPIARAVSYEVQLSDEVAGFGATPITCTAFANALTLASGQSFACGALSTLGSGDVYWRVRGVASAGVRTPWSSVEHFTYAPPAELPTLSQPTVALPTGPSDCDDAATCPRTSHMPLLSWQAVGGSGFYRVQIDRRDAHLPGQTWDTTGTTFMVPWSVEDELDVERFTWQVVACATTATCPAWTGAGPSLRHFAIGDPVIDASPADGIDASGEVTFEAVPSLPAAPDQGEPWDLLQARSLALHVDDEPTFAVPRLFDGEIDARGQAIGNLPAGTIHWRVLAGHPATSNTPVARSFTWSFESSVVGPADGAGADSPAEVTWSPVQGAASYVVEAERDGWHPPLGGGTAWTTGLVGEDFVPGTMSWRVTPADAAGHLGTPVGRTLEILPKDPVLSTPADGSSVPEVGAVFDWDPIDSPVSYRIQVSTTPDFLSLVDDTSTQRTRYVATTAYPLTTLYWRIRAESGYGQIQGEVIGSSAPRVMTMVAGVGDTTPPTVSAMTRRFLSGSALSSGRIRMRIGWTGADPGGTIHGYRVARSVDGGPWAVVGPSVTATWLDQLVTPGHAYRYRVTAIDTAGNQSSPLNGPSITISRYNENNARISYSGTWSTVTASFYLNGAARKSTRLGSKASITFTGRSLAWISRRGPDRGKAEVYVNGTRVATIDLRATTYQNQRVVWTGSWSSSVSRKVTIRVLGTKGRPRVDLDAFVTTN